jgi:hypothetical protein
MPREEEIDNSSDSDSDSSSEEDDEPRKCSKCDKTKTCKDFYKRKRNGKYSLHWWCKVCVRDGQRIVDQKKHKERQEFLCAEKKNAGGCFECHVSTMDLHFAHFNRKDKYRTKNGKPLGLGQLTIKKIKEELKKGRWLCAQCHDVETRSENAELKSTAIKAKWYQDKHPIWQKFANLEKLRRKQCLDCHRVVTQPTIRTFHFDHRDPFTKITNVSEMVGRLVPFQVIRREWEKCDLRCDACHRKRTTKEKHTHLRHQKRKLNQTKFTSPQIVEFWRKFAYHISKPCALQRTVLLL